MKGLLALLSIGMISCGGGGFTCPVGEEGCECTSGGICNPGLYCVGGVCVNPTADTSTDTVQDTSTDTTSDTPVEVECTVDLDCDDDDPCTSDTCDEYGDCQYAPVDADDDGYLASSVSGTACTGGTDCDDSDDTTFPGSIAVDCSTSDHDCNGEGDRDNDGDGQDRESCSGTDCDDSDPSTFLGSMAIDCSTDDHDCNGEEDQDNDGDGRHSISCDGFDCDDTNPMIHEDMSEITCDGFDTNCDGSLSLVEDADQDGYANSGCVATGEETDCDDDDVTIHPGATETCDTIDDDCDGTWADGGADDDADGFLDIACSGSDCDDLDAAYNPGESVSCTSEDFNCNGHPDEDDDGDGHVYYLCTFGDDCEDTDVSVLLGECSGVNECCDGCWQRNGCWLDPTTGYLWEDPPIGGSRNWDSAVAYCAALSLAGHGAGEWHLPTISELRKLIRGCPATEDGGYCHVTDSCLTAWDCWENNSCECDPLGGPGADGCYCDPALEGTCSWYWSSSSRADYTVDAWTVSFSNADVHFSDKDSARSIRCVRPGP